MNKIISFSEGYTQNIKEYTRRDGAFSILLFFIFTAVCVLNGILTKVFSLAQDTFLLIGIIQNIFLILTTLLFTKINKQKIETIGIVKGKIKLSVIFGLVLGFILFMANCGIDLILGSSLKSFGTIVLLAFNFIVVAFCEEIVFRGYIQTRMYGLIKSKWFGAVLVAILFMIVHFPYRMIAFDMSLKTLLIDRFFWSIQLFLMHIVWNYIYTKTNSLYGSIISHWISNLASNILR